MERLPALRKEWKNKIVGHGEESPDQLLANPFNFRIHPAFQQSILAGSIDEVGFIRSVTVNKNTGHIVDGHLRVLLAQRSGVKSLPIEYVDLTEEEEKEALLSIDPIGALAVLDRDKVNEILDSINVEDTRLDQFFVDMREEENTKIAHEIERGELEISGELFERHDYLLFYFDNEFDWRSACEKFGVKQVANGLMGSSSLHKKGIGRVLSGTILLNGNQ